MVTEKLSYAALPVPQAPDVTSFLCILPERGGGTFGPRFFFGNVLSLITSSVVTKLLIFPLHFL